jgi:uncharacterized UPF0146 family protein
VADNKACVETVARYIEDVYPRGARLVEVGVGERDETARRLADAGYDVTASDVRDVGDSVGVDFVRDNVREPDAGVYEGTALVYSLRPPYEIHADIEEVARTVGADLLLAPLGDEGVSFDAQLVSRGGRGFFVNRF